MRCNDSTIGDYMLNRDDEREAETSLHSETIIPFPSPLSRPCPRNRLTVKDRLAAAEWAAGPASAWYTLVVCADPGESEEIGDFISIYKLGQRWASWGLARRDSNVILWRTDCGSDLGPFGNVRDALEAIFPSL